MTTPSCIHRRGCLEPSRCLPEERCCSHDIRAPGAHAHVERAEPPGADDSASPTDTVGGDPDARG